MSPPPSRWCSRRSSFRSRLHRIIVRLGIHREIEKVVGVGTAMLAGMSLVALSMVVMLRVTHGADPLAREDLAFALSVVLLGLLMMVTRRNAVSQVVGFMSLENGLVLAATGAKGMPLVVEISVAFSILIALDRDRNFPVPHPRAFRHGRRAGARPLPRRTPMTIDALTGVLVIPAIAAALLAVLPGYRITARINVVATGLTLLCALSLFFRRPEPGIYLLVDDLNATFIVLTTFVGFTTSIFSASYIGHELEIGRLTPPFVRFYHAMYQVLMFAMNLALDRQQYRPDVGGDRDGDADHRAHGRHLPHPRGAGSGMEIFHSRQRRHRARAVRHHSRLHGGAAGGRRRSRRHGMDRAGQARRRLRSGAARRRLRFPAARLRHQGRTRAAACLAAGCACRGPDADLGGAVGLAAQRRALCAAALQDAARGEYRRAGARPADGDARI